MKCWICSRQSRGLRHADLRHRPTDPRHHPTDWVFCSRRCQEAFHQLYGHWTRGVLAGQPKETVMVDATELEKAAMRLCLKFFGEAANAIGFDKPLGAYTEAEALSVIEAIVTAYVEEMAAHHERARHPPVRMSGTTPINDPLRDPADSGTAPALTGIPDDLPWEAKP